MIKLIPFVEALDHFVLHYVHKEFPDVFVYKMGTYSMLYSC
jgi:hypothetical protein